MIPPGLTCAKCGRNLYPHTATTTEDGYTHTHECIRPRVNRADRAEDVQWMAETGECLTGAAARLGITTAALEVWCRRHDRDSLALLLAREPKDHNRVMSDVSIYELTGIGERKARQPHRAKRRKKVAA